MQLSIQKLESGQNIHQLSSFLEFCSSMFLSGNRDFGTSEDVIQPVGSASGQHPQMFFKVVLGFTDLN